MIQLRRILVLCDKNLVPSFLFRGWNTTTLANPIISFKNLYNIKTFIRNTIL